MGATNHTTNYELSQFIGTDKPSWLNDYNNDMLKIDTAVKANATAASNAQTTANTADGKADGNAIAIQTLNTQINTPDTGLAATVAAHTTAITGINSTIGTTPLTTVAQTLTGAIEEVKSSIPVLSGMLRFTRNHKISITADGTKTRTVLLNELYTALLTYLAAKDADYRFEFVRSRVPGLTSNVISNELLNKTFTGSVDAIAINATSIFTSSITSASSFFTEYNFSTGTFTDGSSVVPTIGGELFITLNEYQLV